MLYAYKKKVIFSPSIMRYFSIKNNCHSPWNVLVFGSSDFGKDTLKCLKQDSLSEDPIVKKVKLVTSEKAPMRHCAEVNSVEWLAWPPNLTPGEYDVGLVVSFGHLIPARIIDKFPNGVLNIHPSLLPRWRGAAPIAHTILGGDSVTGISIMEIKPKHFDVGPVLLQQRVTVPAGITTRQLSSRLSQLGAEMILPVLQNLTQLRECATPQADTGTTYAHKIVSEMSFVNWQEQSAQDIDNQYRAISEQIPLRSRYLDQPIQLLDMAAADEMASFIDSLGNSSPPGTPVYLRAPDLLCIKCRDGWVGFRNVVYKKQMTAASFHNGYLSKPEHMGQCLQIIENSLLEHIHLPKI